jgi:hypothetical protein
VLRNAHSCVIKNREKSRMENRNNSIRHDLSCGPAILSPSPRAWPVVLGAADMPIGCALKFFPDASLKQKRPGMSPAFVPNLKL